MDNFYWYPDCRHFDGGLPCKHWRPCPGCDHYDPVGSRILIVMLGLLGDILIASPLPARIKRDDPAAHITWLVDEQCAPVARMNPDVDRVLPFDWQSAAFLSAETFDAVFSFERLPAAAALVERIQAVHKAGLAYGGHNNGLYAIGEPARHFFKMNTWNDYRTRQNTKTWTELYFEVAGYDYNGEPYVIQVPQTADARAQALLASTVDTPRVCLNVGGSIPTKIWPRDHWLWLGSALLDKGYQIVITGGRSERELCEFLKGALSARASQDAQVRYEQLSIEEFSAVPGYCDVMVTGDSFGFHLALAHQCPAVLLLGPSSGAEVIPKHVTNIRVLRSTFGCSPCAHQIVCGGVGGCMETILPARVLGEVENSLGNKRKRTPLLGANMTGMAAI